MSRTVGRPRKAVDPEMLERLAACGCTVNEMAAVMQCNKRTLERRYATAIEAGRYRGRSSLRHKQFQVAMKGDKAMLIWLGKQVLGQSEKVVITPSQLTELMREMVAVLDRYVPDPGVRAQITAEWTQIPARITSDAGPR